MEDNSCVMKYIEIVPLDNFNNCSDVTDIKQEPVSVEVCVACSFLYLISRFMCKISWERSAMILAFFHNLTVDFIILLSVPSYRK